MQRYAYAIQFTLYFLAISNEDHVFILILLMGQVPVHREHRVKNMHVTCCHAML